MKKFFLITTSALLLAACSQDVEDNSSSSSMETASQIDSTEVIKEDSTDLQEEMESATSEEIQLAETPDDYSSYPELAAQDIFQPSDFTGHLITDNPGTRVFIFKEGETQAYKTVFIKNNQRLKVIDLVNHELLMNEQIDPS